jgi:methylthioribose-1-phosphate isomerase
MKVQGEHYRTIWLSKSNDQVVKIIDQRHLPHKFEIIDLRTTKDTYDAIENMAVRGAPLIGATAAWGVYLSALEASRNNLGIEFIKKESMDLINSRPTAVNLEWAVTRMLSKIKSSITIKETVNILRLEAQKICDEEIENSKCIGANGLNIIKEISNKKSKNKVNILTHCNAGWLATIDYGTATAPIYAARDAGIDIHVWVDETRPRNQGSSLTAWEFSEEGIDHTVIVDNAGGHLMQHKEVDLCIVGSDRTTRSGDVCNKIGTYLKALSAYDNDIPFYAALPGSTFDWEKTDGLSQIPIEVRDADEIAFISGQLGEKNQKVRLVAKNTNCLNIAFDVTPSKYISGLITPRGVCEANELSILGMYPEYNKNE